MRIGSQSRGWTTGAVVALALTALAISVYLASHAFSQSQLLGCKSGNAFSCDEVLGSRWSKVLGVPVAIPGVLTYLLIIGTSLARLWPNASASTPAYVVPDSATVSWTRLALIALAFAAASSGLWFTLLQFFNVGKLCWYCLSVHTCGIAIATLLTLEHRENAALAAESNDQTPAQNAGTPPNFLFWRTALAGVGVTVFMAFLQILFPTVGHAVSEIRTDDLAGIAGFSEGNTAALTTSNTIVQPSTASSLNANDDSSEAGSNPDSAGVARTNSQVSSDAGESGDAPDSRSTTSRFDKAMLVGDQNAGYAIVEVIDYTCDACRRAYPPLERVIERYPDKLAIVVIPIARDFTCNQHLPPGSKRNEKSCKLTRMAIAIWTLDRDSFADFHHWMLAEEKRSLSEAWAYAGKLVGTSELLSMIDDPSIDQRLTVNNRVWDNLGQILPSLIVGGKKIQGMVQSDEELEALIESYLPFNQPTSEAKAQP